MRQPFRIDTRERTAYVVAIGPLSVAALIAAGYMAASISGGDPDSLAALAGGTAACGAVAWLVASISRPLVPGLALAASAMVAVSSPEGLFKSFTLEGPFGYANAKGSFFGLTAIAGLSLGVVGRRSSTRLLGGVAAMAAAAVPIASGTVAAMALLPLAAFGISLRTRRALRIFVSGCAILVVAAVTSTLLMGAFHRAGQESGTVDRLMTTSLSERRLVLWHDAWVILREHPVTGVGPGRFQHVSPTALSDRDSRWAHNEFLQTGAETGLLGFASLVLLFLWGFARLRLTTLPVRSAGLAAAALATLGVQASVDYVFHFPAIPLLGAALIGSGLAGHGSSSEESTALDARRERDITASGRMSW